MLSSIASHINRFFLQLSDSKDCDGACWRIGHLPPIIARITLPASYPSKDPPDVNLSALWLTPKQISIIQDQLLNLWNEAVGVSICYTWVDWLQHDCLAHLSISDTIALEQGEADPQSMPLVMDILQYNAAQKLAAFKQGTWTCGICFEELPGSSCVQASLQCGHAYCQDCMRQHCQLHVKEGSLQFLRCPQPDCKEPLDRPVCFHCLALPSDWVCFTLSKQLALPFDWVCCSLIALLSRQLCSFGVASCFASMTQPC